MLHVYQSPSQPATRFKVDLGEHSFTIRRPRRSLVWCLCCKRLRWAGNARVRVYYDALHVTCAPGKGCKAP